MGTTNQSLTKKVINNFDNLSTKYTPDPLVIAIILSVLVFFWSAIFTGSLQQPLQAWDNGFWKLLNFTLQMSMILLGGYLVATAPYVNKLIISQAKKIKTPQQAIIITTLLSCATSWLNWGFGLVASAIFAMEVGKQLKTVNYRLLVASSYSGFILWHGGLSGSIPLLLNSENNFSFHLIGKIVPLSETIFSSLNLILLLTVTICLLLVNSWLNKWSLSEEIHLQVETEIDMPVKINSPADKLNHSYLIVLIAFILGITALILNSYKEGFNADLNNVNYILFFLALLLQKNVSSFMNSVNKGAKKLGPIIVQYPFYAAIMAILTDTGLAKEISQVFINLSSEKTLPFFTFLSAGLINILVPSGGGQWAVQGPIVIPAALELNASLTPTILAVAWGDAWTNLLQPFWALPLLAIANLKIKDILGFCLLNLIATGVVISLLLWLLA
ncbi:MAG: short-chain fatty acid transporter [Bdellovibrionales bacterium]|nr:short-chain fatty acid transporter [Bdellovibrionales bacterium]